MKGHAMLIRKLVIGAVCILLAAGLTLVLKEVLDTQEPERAAKRPPGRAPVTLMPGAVMSGLISCVRV